MESKTEAARSLLKLAQDVGVPAELFSDHAALPQGQNSDFHKQADFLCIKLSSAKPHTQKHNLGEGETQVLKHRWKNHMMLQKIPKQL